MAHTRPEDIRHPAAVIVGSPWDVPQYCQRPLSPHASDNWERVATSCSPLTMFDDHRPCSRTHTCSVVLCNENALDWGLSKTGDHRSCGTYLSWLKSRGHVLDQISHILRFYLFAKSSL